MAKTIKDLLNQLSKIVIKEAPKTAETEAATSKFVEHINSTFSKQNIGKIAGKVAGASAVANLTDTLIKDVPVANNIYTWYAQAVDKFYEGTVRKLPVVGNWLRKISDTINKLVIPNAQKAIEQSRVNDPKFYQHLGMHVKFQIPSVYPDVVGVPFAGTKNIGSIGFIRLRYNPVSSYAKIQARYTQMLDLLKGIRGLSGEMPYTEGDIFFYDWNTKYLITEYYKLKYCLKLSNIYSMVKHTLPKYLLTHIGFDADDFIKNKALYVELLASMHEHIHDVVPNFGVLEKRISDLLYKLIPDSNDSSIALYYCFMLSVNVLVPDPANNKFLKFKDFFEQGVDVPTGMSEYLEEPSSNAMTYSVYYNNYINYSTIFPAKYKPFGSIRGDLVGSFGKTIFWKDDKIKDIEDCTEESMYHKFDELFLTQFQNGTILHASGCDALPGGTVEYTSVSNIYVNAAVPNFVNGKVTDLLKPNANRDFAQIEYIHQAFNPQGSAGVIYMPQSDGLEALNSLAASPTGETSVIKNKGSYSEGESLEILQLMAWYTSSQSWYDGNSNHDYLKVGYQTMSFYIDDYKLLYYDVNSAMNTYKEIEPSCMYLTNNVTGAFAGITSILNRAMFWSQADYGIKLPLSIVYANGRTDTLLQDYNIMGSISRKTFQTAVLNSAYSLYAADIKVGAGTGKRISNIVEAYRNA